MRKFWASLKFWFTDSLASRGKGVPVDDLDVGASELGWGTKAPRTISPKDDLKVPAGELGWGTRAPKTDHGEPPDPAGEAPKDGVGDAGDD